MSNARPIMIQATNSDAGKSVVVTALCRIFCQDGYTTAPFKSQNMALNSYITPDGKEIGRSQGVQAEAACTEAHTDMNPILIKPTRENESQIVVHGKPFKNMKAAVYRSDFYEQGLALIKESYDRLASKFERIVIEGAGSPAEVNLNDRELVNMKVAAIANSPVILVGDIEKGGVFASLVGTLQLLNEDDRNRVIGVIINKFRGDVSLLEPGLRWFEAYTGKKVLGVIPYVHGLNIDAEDSVVLNQYNHKSYGEKEIDIAVIRYPMISNFTDVDPFFAEEDCDVRFVSSVKNLGTPDVIILPGSKNTIEDLSFLKRTGLDKQIKKLYDKKETVIWGICGGYQMLGTKVKDPDNIETMLGELEGLSFIDAETTILPKKSTVLSEGNLRFLNQAFQVSGYEIHMGITSHSHAPLIRLSDRVEGVIVDEGRVNGTYFHGIFHNDKFRHQLLNDIRKKKGLHPLNKRVFFERLREEAYDKLADHVRASINLKYIEDKMAEFQRVLR
jgi:adenosylcobyric acid synthase